MDSIPPSKIMFLFQIQLKHLFELYEELIDLVWSEKVLFVKNSFILKFEILPGI